VHVPIIRGADKGKLSKRHGAASVRAYAEQGFLPEALLNFIALLLLIALARIPQRTEPAQPLP